MSKVDSNKIIYTLMEERLQSPLDISPFHQWTLPGNTIWAAFHKTDFGYLLRFPDLADYEYYSKVDSVMCYPVPNVKEETTQHLYLNQVLPLALSMHGKLVFHGSAVEVADMAVAFVAESGRGKSTLAANFACKGFRFMTDDGLVLEPIGNHYRVLPSHPYIRLWADSEEALISTEAKIAPALPYTSKSKFLAGPQIAFCDKSRPLRKVYFLGDGSAKDIVLHPLTAVESLMELVKHSFLLDFKEKSLLASHFDRVAKLANSQIHYRLDYPRRFEGLASIRQIIVEHIYEDNTSCSFPDYPHSRIDDECDGC